MNPTWDEIRALPEETVRADWAEAFGRKPPVGAPKWLLALGVVYDAEVKAKKARGQAVSEKMWRRHKMCGELDAKGLKAESDFLTPAYDERTKQTGGGDMKDRRERKPGKPTAAQVLIPMLGGASVPEDESIIKAVRERTGSTKFDKSQLSWYKWKYREGALKGMDGKKHEIKQAEKRAAKAEKPKVKRKVVVKRKKKEAAAA